MKSSLSELTEYPRLSGRLSTCLPLRRCDGVRGSSKSLDVTYGRGLELMINSISTIAVRSSLSVSLACPTIFLRQRLVDFTVLSITSLHQGAFSRLLDRCSCTASSLNTDEPCGSLECFPVIRYKLAWHPPPRCKALEASHECLSRHVSHNIKVNCSGDAESKDANPYLVGCSQAKGSGPTKSTPVNENGGSSLNLNSGKGGGGGARHAGPSNL